MNLLRICCIAVLLTVSGNAADLPRVAVGTDTAEPLLAAFADFLSVSLATASDEYALVERAEITKLTAEAEIQKLSAGQRPVALAKLAKADGLIILGADNTSGQTMVQLGGRAHDKDPLVELETGREAAALSGGGIDQMRGEMPAAAFIIWLFSIPLVNSRA